MITSILASRDSRLMLAAKSKVDESSFQFIGAGSIRSTHLVYVQYSGTDSNSVQYVASNATAILVAFFTTNQPSAEVTYIDAHCFTPRSRWENFYIEFQNSRWWPF